MKNKKQKIVFMMGNEVVVRAARAAGAKIMFGYPITPASEILEIWSKNCEEERANNSLNKHLYLQTEDEMAAGFGTIGACLAGEKAFTSTAGPGNVLMQDAFAMAEALRVPTVAVMMQRGGLSTSTVIYSQEEFTLTCFGGNGEGLRIVYSTSGLQDLYDYTIKAFNTAWKLRFPTFVLADGYQGKMKGEVNLWKPKETVESEAILLNSKFKTQNSKPQFKNKKLAEPYFPYFNKVKNKYLPNILLGDSVNMRNCLNLEEEIFEIINSYHHDFEKVSPEIVEYEEYKTEGAEIIIFAHGIVAAAAKVAVDRLREDGVAVGLFRPITIRPFPVEQTREVVKKAKAFLVTESALGQFGRIVREVLYGHTDIPMYRYYRPALGITPEELVERVKGEV